MVVELCTYLHLIVGVLVNKRRSLLETVEASADRRLWVLLLAGGNVAQECVFVGNEWGLEGLLLLSEVVEGHGALNADGTHIVDCLVLALRHGTYSLHCSVCD